ncbi:MAG: YHS domain-containing protein [Rhodospirillales bacterium]|nr:YHS domain-containing protein [Rhodospirillales bacterium]
MDTILSLLLWGGVLFLMMRFGCGSHMFGHAFQGKKESATSGHGGCGTGKTKRAPVAVDSQQVRWEAPEKDNDPVCGEIVSTTEAKSSVHDGIVYYFCSRECREAFEAAPEHYVGLGVSHNVPRLDHISAKGGSHG